MRFSRNFVDDLLSRVPISEVIGRYVVWHQKKTNIARGDYWACCPFHQEKTPSFHCDNNKGHYHCFGCQEHGDHISFLSVIKGCSFSESVQQIADIAGIPLPVDDPQLARHDKQQTDLLEFMEMAACFFQDALQSQSAVQARSYLRRRGVNNQSIETFRLGYAPDSRNALKEYLVSKGVSKEQIEASGLVVHGQDIAVSYDRFRHRLIFPILSTKGKVIAFGGRALSEEVKAKYLNSNETVLFRKGELLYNFTGVLKSKRKIISQEIDKQQEAGVVIVVEGYMDVVTLHQAGIENVVAPLGTAITERQLQLLWKLAPQPFICFDGDSAGERAAFRLLDLALPSLRPGKSLNYITLPKNKDPDSLVRDEGRAGFDRLIPAALPLISLLWQRETEDRRFDTPEARAALETHLNQLLNTITHRNVRYHYLRDIRSRLNLLFRETSPALVSRNDHGQSGWQNGRFAKPKPLASKRLIQSTLVKGVKAEKPSLREAVLVLTLVNHPQLLADKYDEIINIVYENRDLQDLWSFLISEIAAGHFLGRQEIIEKLQKRGFTSLLACLDQQIRKAGLWTATAEADLVDVQRGYQQVLELYKRSRFLSQQKTDLESQIAEATEQEEEDQIISLLGILYKIQLEINRVENQEAIIDDFGIMSGKGNGVIFS